MHCCTLLVQRTEHAKIKGRCSHGRGAILQRVRPVIEGLFDVNVTKPSVIRKNTASVNKLLAGNAFYFVVCLSLLKLKRL